MLPYGRQSIDQSDVDAVVAALHSDWLTTGPRVTQFEADLEAVAGAPCVAVSNGTTALHTAYAAAGVGAGDEVITTPMTFVATASTAAMLGATVIFADVTEDTANLDPAAVEAAVTGSTRAITAVDYAGRLRRAAQDRRRRRGCTDLGRRARDRLDLSRPAGRHARRSDHLLLLPDEEPDDR
jgi:dTDP-4-amino-4,6-dideoxygalactose transaminase